MLTPSRPPYLERSGGEGAAASAAHVEARGGENHSGSVLAYGRAVKCVGWSGSLPLLEIVSAPADIVWGVSFLDDPVSRKPSRMDLLGHFGFEVGESMSAVIRGTLFVVPETTGNITDPVFARHTLTGDPAAHEALGRFRTDDGTGTALAVAGVRWGSKPVAGEVAILEINLPA